MKYWCATNSTLAYFIELTTVVECQKQLLMSSISNLGGRESLEIAVSEPETNIFLCVFGLFFLKSETGTRSRNIVQIPHL